MNCQDLLSVKNKKKSPAAVVIGALRIKSSNPITEHGRTGQTFIETNYMYSWHVRRYMQITYILAMTSLI